jgi:hypothetical protein
VPRGEGLVARRERRRTHDPHGAVVWVGAVVVAREAQAGGGVGNLAVHERIHVLAGGLRAGGTAAGVKCE